MRHAEKPAEPPTAADPGLNADGTVPADFGPKLLTARGWERAKALVTLFAPPSGPKPGLAIPNFLFASNPDAKPDDIQGSDGPSQRPFQTLTPLAAALGLPIDCRFRKKHYAKMVEAALDCPGVVLIAWQHQDIPLTVTTPAGASVDGISAEILSQAGAAANFAVPPTWPRDAANVARYDLVFVFDRPTGAGPITGFTLVPQMLLPGDGLA